MKHAERRDNEQIGIDHLIETVTILILVFSATYGVWALQELPMIMGA
jgi:hypothetical protein